MAVNSTGAAWQIVLCLCGVHCTAMYVEAARGALGTPVCCHSRARDQLVGRFGVVQDEELALRVVLEPDGEVEELDDELLGSQTKSFKSPWIM